MTGPLSDEELAQLRAIADRNGGAWPDAVLRLLDEHAAQRERIAELERERDLLRACTSAETDSEAADAFAALAAYDAREGGGEDE